MPVSYCIGKYFEAEVVGLVQQQAGKGWGELAWLRPARHQCWGVEPTQRSLQLLRSFEKYFAKKCSTVMCRMQPKMFRKK